MRPILVLLPRGRPLETNLLRLWLRPIYFLASFFISLLHFPSLGFSPCFLLYVHLRTNKYREEKQKRRHSMTLLSPFFFHPPSIPICLCRCRCESHAIDKQQSSHPPNRGKKKRGDGMKILTSSPAVDMASCKCTTTPGIFLTEEQHRKGQTRAHIPIRNGRRKFYLRACKGGS